MYHPREKKSRCRKLGVDHSVFSAFEFKVHQYMGLGKRLTVVGEGRSVSIRTEGSKVAQYLYRRQNQV